MDIHVIDGTYELFRYFYAVPSAKDSCGQEIGAVRGVLGSVLSIIEGGATHVGVATDHVIESFRKYDQDYRDQNNIEIDDHFTISSHAVKKQARIFKSVLKLDKNFHIYIHGDKDLIERGVDEDGRKYYKLYYKEES